MLRRLSALTLALGVFGSVVPSVHAFQDDDRATATARQRILRQLLTETRAAFFGQVAEVGGASFADVPRDRVTVVMRVTQVFQQPARGTLKKGGLVTVGVKDLSLLHRGRTALVFADPWLAGTGLALSEVGSEVFDAPPEPEELANLGREIAAARDARSESRLAAALERSDLVFSGDVQEVRAIPAGAGVRPMRISEHAPLWMEAVVRVTEGLKGVDAGETVVVRFASSTDVAWRDAPKFEKGEVRLLMVERDRLTGAAPFVKVNDQDVLACVAVDPQSVAERPQLELLRQLLKR